MGIVLDHRPKYATSGNQDIDARKPSDISFKGWRAILVRSFKQIQHDHTTIVAAGVAFNSFLSLFPLVIATFSFYGLVVDTATLQQHINSLTAILPPGADELLANRLQDLTQTSEQTLGWGLALGLIVSLWAANRGTRALFEGINIAYNQQNGRNFLWNNVLTFIVTIGALILGGICLLLIAVVPAIVDQLGLLPIVAGALKFTVWPLLFALLIVALGVIYKIAPARSSPQIRWVSVGSLVAAVLWLIGSGLFSFFVANFSNYEETYGSVAAVVVMMLWLFLTSFVVLLGAEINSEMELQTAEDTTIGKERPMGQRNAYHADHVAT